MKLKKLEDNKTYILEDAFKRFTKAIYRDDNLFTQILGGSKSNFYDVSKKEALILLSSFSLSDKEFVSFGIGWNVK